MRSPTQNIMKQNGFTMVELMITLLISSVIMIGVFTTFQNQQKSYGIQDEVVIMQQNLRAAMNLMARELRMASYSPVTSDGEIITATINQIMFTNETDNTGTMQTLQYDLYDAYIDGGGGAWYGAGGVDSDVGRQVGLAAGTKRALAENIDALEFVYLDSSGNRLGDAAGTVTGSDLSKISTIQVSMLARADKTDSGRSSGNGPTTDFLNTFDYFPASCPQPPPPAAPDDNCVQGTAWNFDGVINNQNRFNDGFRRRLLTSTIQLRNQPITP